jgi:hypothetical protein
MRPLPSSSRVGAFFQISYFLLSSIFFLQMAQTHWRRPKINLMPPPFCSLNSLHFVQHLLNAVIALPQDIQGNHR